MSTEPLGLQLAPESFISAFQNILDWHTINAATIVDDAPFSAEDFAKFDNACRKLRSELSEAMALAVRVRNNLATVEEFQSKYGSL